MTLTIDGEQVFWCALAVGVFSVAVSLAVQAGVGLVRLVNEVNRPTRPA